MRIRKLTFTLFVLVALGAAVFALSGCGAPDPETMVDEAIDWIEEADCKAIPNGLDTTPWWLYKKEGRSTVGLTGAVMMDEGTLYVRSTIIQGPGEEPAAPKWVRFSPEDLGERESVDKAKDVLGTWLYVALLEPLLALRTMTVQGEPVENTNGSAWIVKGQLKTVEVLEHLLGATAARRLVEVQLAPDVQLGVTMTADKKTGRPLEVTIERFPGSQIDAMSYTFTRGIWAPASEDVIDLDEYLDSTGAQ